MNTFMNFKIGKKLGVGFGSMALIIAMIIAAITYQSNLISRVSSRVTDVRVPTANASLKMLNGSNHALAALRGWMLLGNDKFVIERDSAWKEEIWPAYNYLKEASKNWTNPENVERLAKMEKILPEFERFQQEIENIAQTRENVPAVKMLFDEAAPQAGIMVQKITQMIDLEMQQAATPQRKALLGMMADVRGSTGLALANIRAFLLGGDPKFKAIYEKFWATNERRFHDLTNAVALLTPAQRVEFAEFTKAREAFSPVPQKMMELRAGKDWNLANYWLATRAAPVGSQLIILLQEMSKDQAMLLAADGEQVQNELRTLSIVGWSALVIGVGLAGLLGVTITRTITGPVASALTAVGSIAEGNLDDDISVNTTDEVGQLLQATKEMQGKLKESISDVQATVDAARAGDLDRQISMQGKRGFFQTLGQGVNELVSAAREAIEDVQPIVDSALVGKLSERISLAGKGGHFQKLSVGVNDLVTITENIINDTGRVLSAMATGDLTESIETDYQGSFGQLKEDANTTATKLKDIVRNIQQSSGSVQTGASEISLGNANLSQRTEEQAASLEETASSMEEMTATVQQNAANAAQANKLAADVRDRAKKGGEVVQQAVAAMSKINDSSKKIADIIGVIDEIAFQTNLLALNASVEAARAGEQGRGFAVVASEVRNLAGRSANAAKEIKDLIQDSGTKVEEGSRLVNESGQTLQEILEGVEKVSSIVAEIASASLEQSSGIDEINTAITQMDELTQQNAALVEQAAAASESLGEEATNMNQLMDFFTVGADSSSGSRVERRSTERPWSTAPDAVESTAPVAAPAVAASGGGDWQQF